MSVIKDGVRMIKWNMRGRSEEISMEREWHQRLHRKLRGGALTGWERSMGGGIAASEREKDGSDGFLECG
jgi:hypothetical protein